MAIALHSFKVDSDGTVRMEHVFYAATESAAKKLLEAHAQGCPDFGPAHKAGDTIEIAEEIDTMPPADEDELHDFLDLEDDEEETLCADCGHPVDECEC
jgi:hypothetical protein